MTDTGDRLATALTRAFDVLEHAAEGTVSFADMQSRLGTNPAATSRLFKAMVSSGLLTADYHIGPRARALGQRLSGEVDLATLAVPAMRRLAEITNESAACFEPVTEGIRMVAKHEPAESYHYMAIGGTNSGIDRHGACRLRAAWWNDTTARARHATFGQRDTADTFLEECHNLRRTGILLTPQDDQPGLARAAAVVCNGKGELLAIIAVTGIAAGWNGQRAASILTAVETCARTLSNSLARCSAPAD